MARVVLITGGAGGMGRAIAARFLADGDTVMLADRTDDALADATAQLGDVETVTADVTVVDDCERMVAATVERFGGLDVMICTAGVWVEGPTADMTEEQWDRTIDVNLKGTFFCAQAAARAMIAGGRRGTIINLASQAIRGAVRGTHYTASKGGVVALTRAIALELAPHGIRVNAIAPGLTDTAQPRYGSTEEEIAVMSDAVPLGRMAQPADIADVAVFLASDAARHITGQTLHVNGGQYLP